MARLVLALSLTALLPILMLAQRGRGNQSGGANIENTIYLSGQVVVEDGSPLPDLVSIERVCRGQVFPEGLTQSDGQFSVQLGSDATAALGDASTYGTDSRGRASGDTLRVGGITGDSERFSTMKNEGTVDLIGCELRASLDGFRSDPVMLTRRSIFEGSDIGTIVLRRIAGVTGASVSATSLSAPKDAVKSYEKARKELAKSGGDPKKAINELEKAVEAYPSYAAAWALLGKTSVGIGDEAGALAAYSQAVEADASFLTPYPQLVKLVVRAGDWQRSVELCERYLKLNPGATEERFYHALSYIQMGRPDEAEPVLDMILADPSQASAFPQARHLKGVILGQKGQFQAAADQFNQFLEAAPDSPASEQVRQQLTEWRALTVIE